MCDPDAIVEAAQELKSSQVQLENWEDIAQKDADFEHGRLLSPMGLTRAEGQAVLNKRIDAAKERLRVLGFTGPVTRVDAGDAVRLVAAK